LFENHPNYYPASYDFENENTGTSGTSINFVDVNSFSTCEITGMDDSHKKVLKTLSSGVYQDVDNNWGDSQTTGIVEFYFYATSNSESRAIAIRDYGVASDEISLVFRRNGKISNYYSDRYYDFADYNSNQWHHIKIQFFCSNHTYNIWVDGDSYGNKNSYGSLSSVDTLSLSSWVDMGETTYWDGFGYSWLDNYTVGDNLEITPKLTVNTTGLYNASFDISEVYYTLNTSINQYIKTYFWNFDSNEWYLFSNQLYTTSEVEYQFTDFNSSFTNVDNSIKVLFIGENETTEFQLNIAEIRVKPPSYLEVESTFQANINSIAYFSYAYNTSVYQNINFSIWNFDTSNWDLVDDSVYSSFTLQSFSSLNSSYYNSSNYFKIRFYGENQTNSFKLNLEVLRVNSYSFLNVSMDYMLDLELRTIRLLYSYATNISQIIELSIYNFDDSNYELLKNESITSFMEYIQSINSSYYNASNYVLFNFYGLNATNEFQLQLEELKIQNSPKMVIELNQTTNLYDNLIYAYRTNITQIINFSIYNNDIFSYETLNSSYVSSFDLFIFSLNSSYYNGSSVNMLFEGINNTFNEFILQIEVMKIRDVSYLNFSVNFWNISYNNILQIEINSEYMTNISQLINYSIYNNTLGDYQLIDYGDCQILTEINQNYNNSGVSNDLINSNYTLILNYYGMNQTHPFNLSIDFINLTIYTKTLLSYTKILQILGTWKYRFILDESLGSEYEGSWIYFNVIEQKANFEIISESRYSSQWVLTGTEASATITNIYEDDLSTDSWTLCETSDDYVDAKSYSIGDSYVDNPDRNGNYGTSSNLYLVNALGYFLNFAFLKIEEPDISMYEFQENMVERLYAWFVGSNIFDLYHCDDTFDEMTITWNNQPTYSNLQDTISTNLFTNEWRYFDVSDYSPNDCYEIYVQSGPAPPSKIYSRETSKDPYLVKRVDKSGHNDTGDYIYYQTDTTELIGIKSPQFGDKNVQNGDTFTITLQTDQDDCQLKLLNDGIEQATLQVLQSNAIYVEQEVIVYVDGNYTFDQVKLVSNLDDIEYVKLINIKAEHWEYESEESVKYIYLQAYGRKEEVVPVGEWNLRIYENDMLIDNKNITLTYEKHTEYLYSEFSIQVYLSFYDDNNEYLDFTNFKTYINYTLGGNFFNISKRLTSNEFYVDEGSTIYFRVDDSFNSLIFNSSRIAESFIDIDLGVYELKFKNEAKEYIHYSLKNNETDITKAGEIFPEEIIRFSIAIGSYLFQYINYEDGSFNSMNLTLSDNKLITINSTYFDVYFAVYNYDGLGLNNELLRFYINGDRRELGFNTLTQDINCLLVQDYFNSTLFNQTINLRGYNEFNINVSVYELAINNKFNRTMRYTIERNDTSILFDILINAQNSLSYRFLPDVNYIIKCYETDDNETIVEEKTILLNEQFKIVDFGFYQTQVPKFPAFLNSLSNNFDTVWVDILLIFMFFGVIVGILAALLYLIYKKYIKTNLFKQRRRESNNKSLSAKEKLYNFIK
jgi:hypothetical protein